MIDRKKYMREYYQKNKHKYKQRRPSYRGALIIYSAPRITSSPLQHRAMAGDGVAEEYAEAMNEMVAATNAAEDARDLAVQERDLARAQLARGPQRPDVDSWPGEDDDAADAADAAADRAERLRANGCLDLMVLAFIVLFTMCWCFFYAGAYDLLALLLVLVMTIFWCL